jgi:hypothetical protein
VKYALTPQLSIDTLFNVVPYWTGANQVIKIIFNCVSHKHLLCILATTHLMYRSYWSIPPLHLIVPARRDSPHSPPLTMLYAILSTSFHFAEAKEFLIYNDADFRHTAKPHGAREFLLLHYQLHTQRSSYLLGYPHSV